MNSKKNNICRFCLLPLSSLYDVFIESKDNLSVSEVLGKVFRLQLTENENSLRYICFLCYEKVFDIFNFYNAIIENENKYSYGERTCNISFEDYADNEQSEFIYTDENNSEKPMTAVCNELKEPLEMEEIPSVKEEISENTLEVPEVTVKRETNQYTNCQESKRIREAEVVSKNKSSTVVQNEKHSGNIEKQKILALIDEMPAHLKVRNTKEKGDQQIKQFIELVCCLCPKDNKIEFDTFKELQLHYEAKHSTRGFVICCNKKIYRKDRIMDHITNHINPDAFKCPKCEQRCKSKVLLKLHMKQHLPIEVRKFKCDKCDQRFVLRSQLTNHEAKHLTDDQKKFVCDECGKAFALKFVLIKHKLTHTKEKKFFCEICAKPFACSTTLALHVKRHRNDKPQPKVQCNDCGQWYKNMETLRTHKHRHKDTRLHICETCNKLCSTKSALAAHIKYVHVKLSDHECKICAKKFRRRLELTEHLARHTGQALYSCVFCSKTFFSSSNYFAHRKNRHPVEFANSKELKEVNGETQ